MDKGVGGLFHLGLPKIIILRAFTLVVLENLTFEHSHVYNRKKKSVEYLQFCLKMTHINSYITVNLQGGWWTFPPRPTKNYHFKSI